MCVCVCVCQRSARPYASSSAVGSSRQHCNNSEGTTPTHNPLARPGTRPHDIEDTRHPTPPTQIAMTAIDYTVIRTILYVVAATLWITAFNAAGLKHCTSPASTTSPTAVTRASSP